MNMSMTAFFSVLYRKINSKTDSCQYGYAEHNIKSFHGYSSLSFGVTKYAMMPKPKNVNPIESPIETVKLPAKILPIIPAVNVYLAASANILATTFLLSLFIFKVYHKWRQYESINA